MKMCDCQSVSLLLLTRRGSHLMPSNLVLVLQCCNGVYFNFVAKILGIHTLLLLCNTPPPFFSPTDSVMIEVRECLLSFGAEPFVFQVAIQKLKE
jgi:hypothetical protein